MRPSVPLYAIIGRANAPSTIGVNMDAPVIQLLVNEPVAEYILVMVTLVLVVVIAIGHEFPSLVDTLVYRGVPGIKDMNALVPNRIPSVPSEFA